MSNFNLMDFLVKSQKFNNIRYVDSDHSYTIDGVRAISGTRLIHQYTPEFDSVAIAKKKAEKDGSDYEVILNDWAKTNATSTVKGTILHETMEFLIQKRVRELDEKETKLMIKNSLNNIETYNSKISDLKHDVETVYKDVKYAVEKISPQIEKLLINTESILIPLFSEFIIGDKDYRICGTIDQLFYNTRENELQIWDWKTNKSIEIDKKFPTDKFMLEPITDIQNTNFWHYSIQLSLYKFILEKNTGIKVGKLWLCHFSDLTEEPTYYECPYLEKTVELILEDNLRKILKEESEIKNESN